MDKIKEWVKRNQKEIIVFFSGVFVFSVIAGSFVIINLVKEKEQRIVELEKKEAKREKKEKKKKQEQKNQQEVEKKEKENSQMEQSGSSVSSPTPSIKTEEDVIGYFYEQERYATGNEQDSTIREKLKNGVTTIYQFLFQGGTIHGKTFSELSSSAKLKVLKIALSIDQKIDTYFPNYKDRIKEGASNLKSKIVVTYLETTNKICTNHEDICTQAREDFKTMKNSFKISFSLISGLVKEGGTAIKEWYLSTKS